MSYLRRHFLVICSFNTTPGNTFPNGAFQCNQHPHANRTMDVFAPPFNRLAYDFLQNISKKCTKSPNYAVNYHLLPEGSTNDTAAFMFSVLSPSISNLYVTYHSFCVPPKRKNAPPSCAKAFGCRASLSF